MVQPRWRTVCQFFTKLDTVLPYNPAISTLNIYTNDLAAYEQLYKQLLTNVDDSFIHNLQNWKQQSYPSVCQWYRVHSNNKLLFTI